MATAAEKAARPKLLIDDRRGLLVSTHIATRRAAVHDLEIEAGRTYSLPITWTDADSAAVVDLTGYTAALNIRSRPGSTAHLALASPASLLLTADGTEPNIAVLITAAQTTALAAAIGRGWYELVLTDGAGVVTRLLEGCVAVKR